MTRKNSSRDWDCEKIVNLVTESRALEDLMLSQYPGLLFEWQVRKEGDGEEKRYIFVGLDYRELSFF